MYIVHSAVISRGLEGIILEEGRIASQEIDCYEKTNFLNLISPIISNS